MRLEIITFYEMCDAYLKQKGVQDDPQAKMTTTEVFVTALVAAWFFASNLRLACATLAEMGVVPQMLSESRFCRRRQRITSDDWQAILTLLSERFPADTFAIDRCPMAACHKRRAGRSRLYRDENNAYWGYCAAKEDFYYGLKAHAIVAASGRPVEVLLLCGCSADLTGLKEMVLALPPGSKLYADKAYSHYGDEDHLKAERAIELLPLRKPNLKRQHTKEVAKALSRGRKRIETTFSLIAAKLPRRIHAITAASFESKILATFVAFAILTAANEKQQTVGG